jgi:hypothetical protein
MLMETILCLEEVWWWGLWRDSVRWGGGKGPRNNSDLTTLSAYNADANYYLPEYGMVASRVQ